jgi:hypothetical protein
LDPQTIRDPKALEARAVLARFSGHFSRVVSEKKSVPEAKYWGTLPLGEAELPVFVLDNGMRVISRKGWKAERRRQYRKLFAVEALGEDIPPDLPGLTIEFDINEVGHKRVQGYSAETP